VCSPLYIWHFNLISVLSLDCRTWLPPSAQRSGIQPQPGTPGHRYQIRSNQTVSYNNLKTSPFFELFGLCITKMIPLSDVPFPRLWILRAEWLQCDVMRFPVAHSLAVLIVAQSYTPIMQVLWKAEQFMLVRRAENTCSWNIFSHTIAQFSLLVIYWRGNRNE